MTTDQLQLTECAHSLCACTLMGPVAGEIYCSDICKSSETDGIESETCACGHPPCDTPQ